MVAQRQPEPEYQRPQLRLVTDPYTLEQDAPVLSYNDANEAFTKGLLWGLVLVSLVFWLPVASALYLWLK
ncbi:MAG: hypothetical protein EXR66_01685 [Dehalococcoidia bacterium]|nr:hypothetical protein [Dehalococcoidia bacterium]